MATEHVIASPSDFPVGKRSGFEHRVSAEQMATFRALSGDDNPLHWDAGFARSLGFHAPVTHGMLVAGLFSKLVGTLLPGPGTLYLKQSLDFAKPVFAGDVLWVEGVVRSCSPHNRIVVLAITAQRQGQVVMRGEATVQLLEEVKKTMQRAPERPVVLVTGGSGGIGSAVARACAEGGMRVAVAYHGNVEIAVRVCEEVARSGGEAEAFGGDLRDAEQVARLLDAVGSRFGTVSVLVNNAGSYPPPTPLVADAFENYLDQYSVTMGAAFRIAATVVPHMVEAGYGRIINIASEVASSVPPPGVGAYAAAKGALLAWTRVLAVELGPKGITVNAVAPGLTDTAMHEALTQRQRQVVAAQVPRRSIGQPEDVAHVVRFLAGPDAGHLTGQTIHVNGGASMH